MQIDVAESPWGRPSKPTAMVLETTATRLAAIFDAPGSWGAGPDGAAFGYKTLRPAWQSRLDSLDGDAIAADLRGLASRMPAELAAEEFGCDFSAVVAHLSTPLAGAYGNDPRWRLQLVCAGVFSALVVRGAERRVLYRPSLLLDLLISEGRIAAEDVDAFAHKNVCVGPFVGHESDKPYFQSCVLLGPGDRLVVGHRLLVEHLADPAREVRATAAGIQDASPRTHPSAVVVLDVS